MLADFVSRTEPIGARGQRKRTMPGLDCSIKATNDAAGGSGATGGGDGDGTVCVGRDSAAAAAGGLCSGYQSPPPPPWGGSHGMHQRVVHSGRVVARSLASVQV
ncbi:hypothetical protein DICSQDRAFT_156651 [Dichomitus squalens LYAD-421 SS1]|uniref:Uncharacterized protein n=1 Tax=Dichomitus squalens (strain LYAD-421) TaxID=732165 RepID=R7SUW8_DICSQ|nr:uncharacterized protein DICSQDRAFT_156651 [Dichomitus squalens LYAD-421 SS1]EJF58757.1 hypothetical protein DICSQDRAFT_156651 [Dichomitus squalens LYAD-421 SS1]